MEKVSKFHEYQQYRDAESNCAHMYILPVLARLIPKNKKLRILDLGCGNGVSSHSIAQLGHEVLGVDSSESGINIARKSFPQSHFIKANIYDLPYEELAGPFDIVISIEVIEHLFYPRALIRAAKRCLKPDGLFIMATPYHGYLKNLALSILNRWDEHFRVYQDGGHIKFFSPKSIAALLKEEDFTDIRFRFVGRSPYLWKSMICYCYLTMKSRGPVNKRED